MTDARQTVEGWIKRLDMGGLTLHEEDAEVLRALLADLKRSEDRWQEEEANYVSTLESRDKEIRERSKAQRKLEALAEIVGSEEHVATMDGNEAFFALLRVQRLLSVR